MNQSENINELASALAKAQGEMQAAIKDCINPFFKSKYADLGSVWDAARPVLSKNGLCVMQTTDMVGEKVVMITTLAHVSGQWVKSSLPLNPSKNDSQGMGAAITYLRRYSLSALVGVVCDDEDDGETAVGRGKCKLEKELVKSYDECVQPQSIQYVSASQLHVLTGLYSQIKNGNKEKIDKWMQDTYKSKELGQLPESAYEIVSGQYNKCLKLQEDQRKMNETN